MRGPLAIVGGALAFAWIVLWVGDWVISRRQQRRIGSNVSARWRHEHLLSGKDGDRS